MTNVPGTYFTKEQLEVARKVDKVWDGGHSGSCRINHFGYVYKNEKKQYDKALAWFIIAARENHSISQNNIGVLYNHGHGVPQNYLCALKWYLKAAEGNTTDKTANHIGNLFENGYGVPPNKYKALEWYCHGGDKANISRLNGEGYIRSATDKRKSHSQLAKETKVILDAEKKKLEEKQNKTQEEIETLEHINIAYKTTSGNYDAWENVPILLPGPFAEYFNELKKQIQILSQESSAFKDQDVELQSLKQEKQTMEQDKRNITNEMERLKSSYTTLEQLLKAKEDTIISLNRENQMLLAANQKSQQGANEMIDTLKNLLQAKTSQAELLKQNMEHVLDKEKERNKKLQKEIKRLKQTANSREASPSSNVMVPEFTIPNTDADEDDPNNDFNFDTEYGTEYTSLYGTSSEDGDHANDLNYDSDV